MRPTGTDRAQLDAHYDAMWTAAFDAVAGGDVACDARLAAGADPRRGLTLIARPGPALAARFDAVLDRLTEAEPGQYRHPAADMHVTMLSLFTVTDDPGPELARLEAYRAAVHAALAGTSAFRIDFDGLSLSRGAVIARGFPQGPVLETLRGRLRAELRARGLDASLDARYRLVTAHATLLRFIAPLRNPGRFAAVLESLRDAPLGSMQVEQVELVINDWTMSSTTLQQIDAIALSNEPAARDT